MRRQPGITADHSHRVDDGEKGRRISEVFKNRCGLTGGEFTSRTESGGHRDGVGPDRLAAGDIANGVAYHENISRIHGATGAFPGPTQRQFSEGVTVLALVPIRTKREKVAN